MNATMPPGAPDYSGWKTSRLFLHQKLSPFHPLDRSLTSNRRDVAELLLSSEIKTCGCDYAWMVIRFLPRSFDCFAALSTLHSNSSAARPLSG